MTNNNIGTFTTELHDHETTIQTLRGIAPVIEATAQVLINTIRNANKVMLCGNGGSAADAQHIAAEFMVRYEKSRPALPAMALTTDTSILTAHTNDYDFSTLFSRQVQGLGRAGDCLIAISTSGNSDNIITAAQMATQLGLTVIALTGNNGGKLAPLAQYAVIVPSTVTARIQEAHILIGHYWCKQVEIALTMTTLGDAAR